MANEPWKLERELCQLAGEDSITNALHKMGLLRSPSADFELIDTPEGWFRSGAETYLFRFQVRTDGTDVPVVLKACVGFSIGANAEEILEGWIERRQSISKRGVQVPHLYAWGRGLILEEEIRFALSEVLQERPASARELCTSMARVAGVVTSLGFLPVELFKDLRSRGDDVVVVDFGQDLGPLNVVQSTDDRLFNQLIEFLDDLGLRPDSALHSEMHAVFLAASVRAH